VKLSRDSTGVHYAIKKILKGTAEEEIEINSSLQHPNIAKYFGHFTKKEKAYLIFEYIEGGDLSDLIVFEGRSQAFCEPDTRYLFFQLVQTVQFCHSRGIFHRDLKLDNIRVTSQTTIKVLDFGLAGRPKEGEKFTDCVGSWEYTAPEILSRRAYYGAPADVYSMGVVLYLLLHAAFPFSKESKVHFALRRSSASCHPNVDLTESQISETGKDLISRMLENDPENRITLEDVLKHPWMKYQTEMY